MNFFVHGIVNLLDFSLSNCVPVRMYAIIFMSLCFVVLGLTSSIILKNGRLPELIGQLQELLKGVDEVEIAPYKYDTALLAAQVFEVFLFIIYL